MIYCDKEKNMLIEDFLISFKGFQVKWRKYETENIGKAENKLNAGSVY